MKRNWPLSLVSGAVIFGAVLLLVALSYVWLPWNPLAMDIPHRLLAPSPSHPFGTDQFGRDVFANVLVGGRISLAVAVSALAIGLLGGVPIGLFAASQGGIADSLLARFNDLVFAFPALLIAALISGVAGHGAIDAIAAIGIFNIPVFARVTRAAARSFWQRDYIAAAITSGKTRFRIVAGHIFPNLLPALLIQAAIQVSLAILAEAGLAYVGLGAQPPAPDWGRMLQSAGTLIDTAPWLAIFPGIAILLTSFALSLISDGLRDVLDPRR